MKKLVVVIAVVAGTLAAFAEGSALRDRIAKGRKILKEESWQGFHRVEFDFGGHVASVVEPSAPAAEGRPWTWTIQWWHAFVDRTGVPDLLKRGFHHVWIDLFETRMNEEGLAAAAAYQDFLVKELGFAPKANLIGMSWGGFFSTRYAAAHPENVGRIYYDAPLLSFDGFGNPSYGRIGWWANNLPKDGNWAADPRMPVNMAEKIAAAKIPIFVLYGGADRVVPPEKNIEVFLPRFKAAGGVAQVEKRGLFGHHPHGLDPNKTSAIVNFFMGR